MSLIILYESASGFALFEAAQYEAIGESTPEFQKSVLDFGRFSKIVKLKAFTPFTSAENALENVNDVSEGVMSPFLKNMLEMNLPKKASKFTLGVTEDKLGTAIQEQFGYSCEKSTTVLELTRGIRLHFERFLNDLKEGDLFKAQLGLGHSYSRSKVKFNVNRVDNMIIQSICLLDQLDKDLNTFSMRVREWYSWHFPELAKIVTDNVLFTKVAKFIKNKERLSEDDLEELEKIVLDEDKAKEILSASISSMGTDISEYDLANIETFADKVLHLHEYRAKLHEYLISKMHSVAPNLSALIGELVGARLISQSGSLTNLAKYPASTVQILGAEKALFRALKTKGNTPKYGLIFNSTFIGRAQNKYKGRISRYLANKCSIASRIDAFSENLTSKFGEKLREQVEDRLTFYDTPGQVPKKNVDAMREVLEELAEEMPEVVEEANGHYQKQGSSAATPKQEKKKKKKKEKVSEDEDEDEEEKVVEKTPKKGKQAEEPKKSKKKKKSEEADDDDKMEEEEEKPPKKKKKAAKKEESDEEEEEEKTPKKKKKAAKKEESDEEEEEEEKPQKKSKEVAAESEKKKKKKRKSVSE